ncbi:NlpC/P60 family protein [Streptomyces sp. NPDC047123]|uniref:C40 family peptidase n=1 Tax=Streptomyces sp. NPDC047123 TaxID=3155622 RepID=UPI0033DA1A3A
MARGAVLAAAGTAALLTVGAGTASAEPAPSRAGWDGSRYWYKDATGWWRWTSHKDRYEARTGTSGATGTSRATGRYEAPGRSGRVARGDGGSLHGTPSRHGSATSSAAARWAQGQLGKPYVWGGSGPYGFDCSGLVQQAFRHTGVSLPRVADAQYRAATRISRSELRPGDLLFWSSDGSAAGIHHVAIYLGGDTYVESPRPGKQVRVSSFSAYHPNLYGRVG